MDPLTPQQLSAIFPTMDVDRWCDILNQAMSEWHVDTPTRQAAFLAQVGHESGAFRTLVENLNYSAKGLRATWPGRFPNDKIAAAYERQPERIANLVYANRLGNGPETSGDGWRYRGRGLIQVTGRSNYDKCGSALNIDAVGQPDLLVDPFQAARSACWFWNTRGLNEIADHVPGDSAEEDFKTITKLINGGLVGYAQRHDYWTKALQVLGATD